MIATIIIILAALLVVVYTKNKKSKKGTDETVEAECENCGTLGSDTDLNKLQVYYNGGVKITEQETIIAEGELALTAKGFDIKGKEVYLKPSKLTWNHSCSCINFGSETGITNTVVCSKKGSTKRNVWIKYESRTFSWKIQFK